MPHPDPPPDLAAALAAEAIWVVRLAQRLANDANAADDAAQSAMAAALERQPSAAKSLRPWLARALRNIIFKNRRSATRRAERERAAAPGESLEPADEVVARASMHRAVVEAVLRLEEPYRSTILFRYMDDLPPREIAARMGAPARTVQTRIQRGLERLREDLIQQKGNRGIFVLAAPALWRDDIIINKFHYYSLFTMSMGMKSKMALCGAAALLLVLGIWSATALMPAENAAWSNRGEATAIPPAGPREFPSSRAAAAASRPESRAASILAGDLENVIYGRVTDTAGVPVAGANISIFDDLAMYSHARVASQESRAKMRRELGKTVSNALGEFKIPANLFNNYNVKIERAGFGTVQLNDRRPGESLQITLARACAIVGDVVRQDGVAVENPRIELISRKDRIQQFYEYYKSDQKGHFEIHDLPPGEFTILAIQQMEKASGFFGVLLEEGATSRIEISVEPGRTISGRVTDAETGAPVEGAIVSSDWPFHHFVKTDFNGLYMLDGCEISQIYVKAPGYGNEAIQTKDEGHETKQNVTLTKERIARGRLVDDAGKPVAGAWVLAGAENKEYHECFSEADGKFTIRQLNRSLHHTLRIRKHGFGSVQYLFPTGEEAKSEIDFGDIALQPAGSVSGIVQSTLGAPVADAEVSLSGVNADTDKYIHGEEYPLELVDPNIHVRSDARGRFVFTNIPEGEFNLSAWVPGSCEPMRENPVRVRRGENLANVNITVDLGLAIRGVVIGPDARPVAGAYVAVLDPRRENEIVNYLAYMHTNLKGEFTFIGLAPGNYSIEVVTRILSIQTPGASRDSCAPDRRIPGIAAGSESLRIETGRNAPIEGTIVGRDGQSVEGVSLWAKGKYLQIPVKTDERGRFRLDCTEGTACTIEVLLPVEDTSNTQFDDRVETFPDIHAGTKDLTIRLKRFP